MIISANPTLSSIEKVRSGIEKNSEKLLAESALRDELGLGQEPFKESLRHWQDYNVITPVRIADATYWLLTSYINQQGGLEKSRNRISSVLGKRQKEKDQLLSAQKEKAKQQWLKREMFFSELFLKCGCGEIIPVSGYPFYATGSSAYKKVIGLDSLAGSVSCPKCKKSVYFAAFHAEFGNKEFLKDENLLSAIREFQITPFDSFPEGMNSLLTKIWQKISGRKEEVRFR